MTLIATSTRQLSQVRHLIYGLHPLLEVLDQYAVEYADIMEQFEVSQEALTSPDTHITPSQELGIIAAALERMQQPHIGLELGQRYHLTSYGLLGLAAMSCRDLQSCYEMIFKYIAMTWTYFQFSLLEKSGDILLSAEPMRDLGSSYRFMLDRDLCAAYRIGSDALGKPWPLKAVYLKHDEPEYTAVYQQSFPCPVIFNSEYNALCFEKRWLNEPLAKSDLNTASIFEAQCAAACELLSRDDSFSEHIRYRLTSFEDTLPGLESLASKLHTTPRTLQRKLAAEGTSYKELLEEVRLNLAIEFLHNSKLTMEDIASRLGYQETSSFSHAFKSWTGKPPSAFRKAV